MLMWSLFLWWENSLNPYDSNETLHGFIGWVQWHIDEKLHKICKFKNIFFLKWALNNHIQKLKQHLSTGIYFLDAYNHYITFFGKSFKEKMVEHDSLINTQIIYILPKFGCISLKSVWNLWNGTKNEKISLCDVKNVVLRQKTNY